VTKGRSVARSASSGRFVTKAYAKRAPAKTTVEQVGGGTGNSRAVTRSASSGRFVSKGQGDANPGGTIRQQV
jgi:hypothetical protein